jgi:hypothetical protein
MKVNLLVFLNILSFVGTLAVNTLANSLPINGKNTGELSALYPNEFVPAEYTFSIWLLIYLSLAGFVIYQAGAFTNSQKHRMVGNMGVLFIVTNLLNMSWILVWHYMIVGVSVLVMLGLLLTLIAIHFRFNIPKSTTSTGEKLWIQIPFSIYLGWIMIATIANITTLLVDNNWNGYPLSGQAWAIIMIIIASLLCIIFLWRRKNYIIPMVAIWSITGIINKQRSLNGWNDVAVAGAICCFVMLLSIMIRKYRKTRPGHISIPGSEDKF